VDLSDIGGLVTFDLSVNKTPGRVFFLLLFR
jgi:hypothetical protein